MVLLSALKFVVVTLGGLAGLTTLFVSHVLQHEPEASPEVCQFHSHP